MRCATGFSVSCASVLAGAVLTVQQVDAAAGWRKMAHVAAGTMAVAASHRVAQRAVCVGVAQATAKVPRTRGTVTLQPVEKRWLHCFSSAVSETKVVGRASERVLLQQADARVWSPPAGA
jgi:hypothetical protein